SLSVGQLGLHRALLAIQFPPPRVDYRPLGLRNFLGCILAKQINGKVFHHVVEEVFLRPATEQSGRIYRCRIAEGRADEAYLVPAGSQLANLAHPEAALLVADPRPSLGQFQRNLLTSRQRRFVLLELGVRPIVLGIFVIGDASNAVRLPHLLEELRAVSFAVEQNHETSAIAISLKLGYGWLAGDLVEKTRHDFALECFEKSVVDRPLNGEERLA